jgi:hypothetical protein
MFRTLRISFCALVLIGTIGAGAKILGSADGETPGTHIDVTQLKRVSGDMVSMQYVLSNDTDATIPLGGLMDGPDGMHDNATIAGVYLDDGTTKYTVVRDADGKCVCSSSLTYLYAKSKVNLWAKFSAPPAKTKTLTVDVPHFPPIDDVPLTPLSQ